MINRIITVLLIGIEVAAVLAVLWAVFVIALGSAR